MTDPISNEVIDNSLTLMVNSQQGHHSGKRGGFASRGRNTYGIGHNSGPTRVCSHCSKFNHTVETCYFNHGFPLGYQSKGKSQVNLAANESKPCNDQELSTHALGFTPEQYQGILELLQQSKINSQPKSHMNNSVMSTPLAYNSVSNFEPYQEDDWFN